MDTCPTASVCCNADLVTNIRKYTDDEILAIVTNGGEQKYDHMATLKARPINVHCKSDFLASIIALSDVVAMPGIHLVRKHSQ